MFLRQCLLGAALTAFASAAMADHSCTTTSFKKDVKVGQFTNSVGPTAGFWGELEILNESMDSTKFVGVYLQLSHLGTDGGKLDGRIVRMTADAESTGDVFTFVPLTENKKLQGEGELAYVFEDFKVIVDCKSK